LSSSLSLSFPLSSPSLSFPLSSSLLSFKLSSALSLSRCRCHSRIRHHRHR
jgi:hypothetical protein